MTPVARIAKTTAFKLSAVYLLVFSAFALIFVFSISYTASEVLNGQLADSVEEEILNLADPWNDGGVYALIAAIQERSSRPGAALYLLVDPMGRLLAGNVTRVSGDLLADAVRGPITTVYFDTAENQREAVIRAVRLGGGYTLLVGRDIAESERFGSVIRTALILAGALLIALAMGSWFFVSRRVLKRIDAVSDATRRIMAGDLSGRLEVLGTDDEFDRLAASLNAMLERIEHLLSGLRSVSDNIAHDLKTPLTRMRNRIETALGAAPDSDAQRAVLQDTIDEADQLIRTFNALLMISRIEAGAPQEARELVDLAVVAADVGELYGPAAEEAGATLTVSAEGPLNVRGNRELLGQALANLIDNALKYAGGAGREPRIAVTAARDGGDVVVTVTDNGPGIPERDRERVFGRFVRLEESRSTPGTGLGLSLVAAVVTLHGGTVTLGDAAPGLAVAIRLPAAVDTP
ncbi:MAG: HAMP domain-containing histidine kinase [Bauldia sp.]|nr:HAMP domain-containing histidine kinase [Bauldia sp.]